MPDIHELKVLQTGGGNSEITFEGLSAFVAKLQAVAEHLGIPLKLASKQTPPKNKTKK